MIDLESFRQLIIDNTGYQVEFAKDTLPNFQTEEELPIIYVAYATIDSKEPNVPLESTIFNTNGENLVQSFEVHILCAMSMFREVWINLYTALIGQNTNPDEVYHTGFTYAQGGKMGLSNGKLVWVELWRIGFPTSTPLT